MKKRVDLILFENKLANSRTQAQELIKQGRVYYYKQGFKKILQKPGEEFAESTVFYIEKNAGPEFVSRAGYKLFGALEELSLEVNNKSVLDVGVSTGGFSDCVLQAGASLVIGIEVGHGQTVKSVIENPRFKLFEGVNARNLSERPDVISEFPQKGFDLIIMDVSFISIKLILTELGSFLNRDGKILTLVKPQFELGPEHLNRGGLVKNIKLYPQLEKNMVEFARGIGFKVIKYISSKVSGKDGNQEFFLLLEKQ